MAPVSSGTVATYPFTNQDIINHACRRAGILPQKLGAEDLKVCLDLLFTLTAEWTNAGFPLWTREFKLLGVTIGSPDVASPSGTVEVLDSYWRIFQPYRGACTLSGGAGNTTLFGGQPNADVVVPGANPSVTVNFTSQSETDTVGVLSGAAADYTVALQLYGSNDGATFTLVQTLPSATYSAGKWTYFDLNPTLVFQYLRIVNPIGGSWTLNQLQFARANGQDILNGPLNIDDYYNLPNKLFRSDRPNSMYQDRKVPVPIMKIWPVPSVGAFYNGTISALTRRYIQDPGSLTNIMEMTPRWYEAMVWRLSSRVIDEIHIADASAASAQGYGAVAQIQDRQARVQRCEQQAARSEALVWSEERVRAPVRLLPNMRPYTA